MSRWEREECRELRVKLSDAAQIERLLQFLAMDSNIVVSRIDRDEVEVSFLGSLNTSAQAMQSHLRVQLWVAANPDVVAIVQR